MFAVLAFVLFAVAAILSATAVATGTVFAPVTLIAAGLASLALSGVNLPQFNR